MISTEKTLLRAPLNEDIDLLFRLRNDIQLQENLMSRARPNDVKKVNEWITRRLNDENSLFFIIADAISNSAVGFIQLINIDFISRKGDLGICIDNDFHGKGYATDSLSLLETYAKNVFNIRKIVLQVLKKNERAIRFYIKNGYYTVGTFRDHIYFNDTFEDVHIMEKIL